MTIYTHNDLDGIVSAIVLIRANPELASQDIRVILPTQITDEEFDFGPEDYVLDLPLPRSKIKFWADHHKTNEDAANRCKNDFVFNAKAKSCAGLLYKYFLKENKEIRSLEELVLGADKIDAADLSLEEIVEPGIFGKLSITLRGESQKEDNQFMIRLIRMAVKHSDWRIIFEDAEYKRRIEKKMKDLLEYRENIKAFEKVEDGVIAEDRFWLQAKYPKAIAQVTLLDDSNSGMWKIGISQNIFNKENKVNIGRLLQDMASGGGHPFVGGGKVSSDESGEEIIKKIIKIIKEQKEYVD